MIAAAAASPPGFPPVWAGVPIANYTMVGYDAGTLNVQVHENRTMPETCAALTHLCDCVCGAVFERLLGRSCDAADAHRLSRQLHGADTL
jgi:hypothetical protein